LVKEILGGAKYLPAEKVYCFRPALEDRLGSREPSRHTKKVAAPWQIAVMLIWIVAFFSIGPAIIAWEESKMGPLQRAARSGNVALCERLVKAGHPVDETDADGNTAIHFAVFYCKIDAVSKLIELGADVNHASQRGLTPLMYTAVALRGRSVLVEI
jgi:Ankyrin repeats (many copies)